MITPRERDATTSSSWWATSWLVRWMAWGEALPSNEVEFRRDVVRLILLYRQSGYMRAVVDTSVRRASRDVYIHVPDSRRRAGSRLAARRSGDGILDVAKTQARPAAPGRRSVQSLPLASVADTNRGQAEERGYPTPSLRNFDSEAGVLRAEVELDVQPGPACASAQ